MLVLCCILWVLMRTWISTVSIGAACIFSIGAAHFYVLHKNAEQRNFEAVMQEERIQLQQSSSSTRSVSASFVSCPSGTTSNAENCEAQCEPAGGTCTQEGECYSCIVLHCPEGTFTNTCPTNCANGCTEVGGQDDIVCYSCTQTCEEVCKEHGYTSADNDYSEAIEADLQAFSCVSGVRITLQTANIGSCTCTGSYDIVVDETPPSCTNTPCGTVACGEKTTCTVDNTTHTVDCTWNGWEQIGANAFAPRYGS